VLGKRLPSERRVGRLRITPTCPPLGAGAADQHGSGGTPGRGTRVRNEDHRVVLGERGRGDGERGEREKAAEPEIMASI